MLDALRNGDVDAVTVWKSDRLFRGIGPAADLLDAIEAAPAPVQLHSVTDTIDRKTLGLYAAIAGMERQNIRERMSLGKLGAAKAGRVPDGTLSVGYRRGPDGSPVVHEPEAEIVRRIFAESVAGRSTNQIADGLNMDGVPTPNGRGLRWHDAQVSRILRSETYAGRWQYGDTGVTVDFPPVVDADLWEAAQDARKRRTSHAKRNTKHPYLLQHLITCSECKRVFSARTKSGAKPRAYYVCTGVQSYGMDCRKPKYLRADKLDAVVWQETADFLTDPEAFAGALDTYASADVLDADIDQLQRDIDRLSTENERAAHLYTSGRIDDRMFDKLTSRTADRMDALTDRLAGLKRQRRETTDRAGLVDSVTAWAARISDGIEGLDHDGRREIVRLILDGIEIDRAGLVKLTFRLPVLVGEPVTQMSR